MDVDGPEVPVQADQPEPVQAVQRLDHLPGPDRKVRPPAPGEVTQDAGRGEQGRGDDVGIQ